jgi:hypothetical protein
VQELPCAAKPPSRGLLRLLLLRRYGVSAEAGRSDHMRMPGALMMGRTRSQSDYLGSPVKVVVFWGLPWAIIIFGGKVGAM